MYLRTLLYALRQGVMLDRPDLDGKFSVFSPATQPDEGGGDSLRGLTATGGEGHTEANVPDRLLDVYLSTEDSISLTSKVLNVYAGYIDEGEASYCIPLLHVTRLTSPLGTRLRARLCPPAQSSAKGL